MIAGGLSEYPLLVELLGVEAHRIHRKHQLEEKLGTNSYEDSDLVCATRKGTPLDAQNIVKPPLQAIP